MTLTLATAGESHGPALVAILGGLPAGLVLDREAIDADLARRQQGYGRSPRQQLEQDTVEVLAGLRHGRTLGTPLALVVRNRDHANWEWGMSPWPPEGEPSGKGSKPVTLPRPGHADLAGSLKYGLADARDALERASARQTAVAVAAGSVAKALLGQLEISVDGRVVTEELEARIDEARADRDTVGGVVEVRRARRAAGPRLVRLEGRAARRAAGGGADGHPGGQGRRARRRLRAGRAARLGGPRRDPRRRRRDALPRDELRRWARGRRLERRAGGRARGDEAAADADEAAALGRPRDRRGRARRWSSAATWPRSRRWPSSPRPPSPSSSRARPARSSAATRSADFVGAWRAYLERIPWRTR